MVGERTQQLGDYVELVRGTTYSSSRLGEPGPVLLGLASIQRNGGFRSDNLKTYGGKTSDHLLLRPGDLYVSLKDVTQSADLLGSIARVPKDISLGRLTQDTVKLTLRPGADRDFIYWILRTSQYRTYCRAHATGTTNLGLPRSDFLAFPICEPTPDRLALVGLLQTLDEKIELNRDMAETLEGMARTLFQSWFIDFGPVRAKAEGRPTGLPEDLSALFPDSFDEDGLPEGWRSRANEVGELVRSTVDPNDVDPKSPYVGLEHIGRRDLVIQRWGLAEDVDSTKFTFQTGDLLFGKLRPYFHKVAVAPSDGICSSDIFVFRPRAGVPSSFLYLSFSQDGFVETASNASSGTRMPRADWSYMRQLPAVLPSPELLSIFNQIVSPQIEAMLVSAEQSRTLAALRDALLPRLISGELHIAEVEREVAAA